MLEFLATGKSIEKAIENGLLELKAQREDVDIKIIDEGGLFKKAKVLVKISEDCEDKYLKRQKLKQVNEEEIKQVEKEIVKTDIKKETKDEEKTQKSESKTEILEEKPVDNLETKTENVVQKDKEIILQENSQTLEIAKKFLTEIAQYFDAEIDIIVDVGQDGNLLLTIVGNKASDLIGYRGECLNSLQNLLNTVLASHKIFTKAYLNIENYKEKREETLIELAKRSASKVLKTKKSVRLEPMNSFERRIIHSALTSFSDIISYSSGEEPRRYLTICYREGR